MSGAIDLFDAVSLPVKMGWALWIVWGIVQMLSYRSLRAVKRPALLPEAPMLESNPARRRPSATRGEMVDPRAHAAMSRRRRRRAPSPAQEPPGEHARVA